MNGGEQVASADLLTVEEAAAYIRMSVHWVYKASADGRLPCVKMGSRTRFRREDLDEWLRNGGSKR